MNGMPFRQMPLSFYYAVDKRMVCCSVRNANNNLIVCIEYMLKYKNVKCI